LQALRAEAENNEEERRQTLKRAEVEAELAKQERLKLLAMMKVCGENISKHFRTLELATII